MSFNQFDIRKATTKYINNFYELYRTISKAIGGLSRAETEITHEYITNVTRKSVEKGVQFVIIDT